MREKSLWGRATGFYLTAMIGMKPSAFHSTDEVLLYVLTALLREGREVSPRGVQTSELLGHSFRLLNPRARRISLPRRGWKESLAVGEFCWHLSQSNSVDALAYYTANWANYSEDGQRITSSCYGRRIFGGGIQSQWSRVKRALATDIATRRAVLALADTEVSLESAKDVSCLTAIQFIVRDGRLNCITTMRSCDVMWGLCYDVYLCTMLQELMAVEIGVEVGWYQHSCGSLHLYERFAEMAEQIANEGLVSVAPPMSPLTSPEFLPAFLEAEVAMRENRPDASEKVASLPEYWRELAIPLRRLQALRWPEASSN